jgi:DNA-binding transcriptional LysR family regulator
MGVPPVLDLELLRTLVMIAEEGSFTRAAERVGRTQSAVSLQVQRLEGFVGHAVLSRSKGGTVELTAEGRFLVERSRELLALNDKVLISLRGPPTHDAVRLGVPEAFSQLYMPSVLSRFAKRYPTVAEEISHGASCEQVARLRNGDLDLIVCQSGHEPRQWPAVELWRAPLRWITSETYAKHLEDPLPLSLSPGNCPWRPPWLDECVWRGSRAPGIGTSWTALRYRFDLASR